MQWQNDQPKEALAHFLAQTVLHFFEENQMQQSDPKKKKAPCLLLRQFHEVNIKTMVRILDEDLRICIPPYLLLKFRRDTELFLLATKDKRKKQSVVAWLGRDLLCHIFRHYKRALVSNSRISFKEEEYIAECF